MGTPTYFSDVTAELKGVLDRTGLVAVANGGLLYGKIGAAVVSLRRGGSTHAFDTINHMFMISGVIVPGSSYWNMGFGFTLARCRRCGSHAEHAPLGPSHRLRGQGHAPVCGRIPKMPELPIG